MKRSTLSIGIPLCLLFLFIVIILGSAGEVIRPQPVESLYNYRGAIGDIQIRMTLILDGISLLVIWQEGIDPLIVVELLSPSSEKEDLGKMLRDAKSPPSKWEVYERWLRVPYYVTFSRYNDELRIFKLSGTHYQEVSDHQGRFWVEGAELGLGLWQGSYLNEDRLWLRWYDCEGNWIPTPAEQERKEKEAALQKAEQLAAKLRELGVDPDQL